MPNLSFIVGAHISPKNDQQKEDLLRFVIILEQLNIRYKDSAIIIYVDLNVKHDSIKVHQTPKATLRNRIFFPYSTLIYTKTLSQTTAFYYRLFPDKLNNIY